MYYFTLVTYSRRPILTTSEGRQFLRESITTIRDDHPFRIFGTVLLPDHWHLIMQLPPDDADYSGRIKQIKERFTYLWLEARLPEAEVTESQKRKGERGIWQPRFWEHTIDDEDDLERCVDYIHWNSRKHGLVRRVRDYPWSSFHRFVRMGQYDIDWGGSEPSTFREAADWGEP
jgi:putative transposase